MIMWQPPHNATSDKLTWIMTLVQVDGCKQLLVISDRRLCKNNIWTPMWSCPKTNTCAYIDILQTVYSAYSPNIGKPDAAAPSKKAIPDFEACRFSIGDLLEPCPIGLTAHLASRWTCMLLEQGIWSLKQNLEWCTGQDDNWQWWRYMTTMGNGWSVMTTNHTYWFLHREKTLPSTFRVKWRDFRCFFSMLLRLL